MRSISSRNEIGDLIRNVWRQGNCLGISRRVGSLIRGSHHFEEMIGIRQEDELCGRRRLFQPFCISDADLQIPLSL
jgi:hypothetical protein